MLLAVRADDRQGFDRLYDWTRRTLQRPRDALHSWRYRPDAAIPAISEQRDRWRSLHRLGLAGGGAALGPGGARGRGCRDRAGRAAAAAAAGRDLQPVAAGAAGLRAGGPRGGRPRSYYVFPAFPLLACGAGCAWARLAADGLTVLRLAGPAAGNYRRTGCRSAAMTARWRRPSAGCPASPSMRCGCRSGWPGPGCTTSRRCSGRSASGQRRRHRHRPGSISQPIRRRPTGAGGNCRLGPAGHSGGSPGTVAPGASRNC